MNPFIKLIECLRNYLAGGLVLLSRVEKRRNSFLGQVLLLLGAQRAACSRERVEELKSQSTRESLGLLERTVQTLAIRGLDRRTESLSRSTWMETAYVASCPETVELGKTARRGSLGKKSLELSCASDTQKGVINEVVHQWIEPNSAGLLLPGVGRLRGRQRGGHQGASVQGEGNNPRVSHRSGPVSGRVLRDHPWTTGGGCEWRTSTGPRRRLSWPAEVVVGDRYRRNIQPWSWSIHPLAILHLGSS